MCCPYLLHLQLQLDLATTRSPNQSRLLSQKVRQYSLAGSLSRLFKLELLAAGPS